MPCGIKRCFYVQEHRSRRYVVVGIQGHVSVGLIHCNVVLLRARTQNCLALSIPFSSICYGMFLELPFRIVCPSWTGG
jgi:hypothetical protein